MHKNRFCFWPRLSSGPHFGKYNTPPNFVVDWGGEYPFLISLSRQHIRCLDAQSGFMTMNNYDHLATLFGADYTVAISLSCWIYESVNQFIVIWQLEGWITKCNIWL